MTFCPICQKPAQPASLDTFVLNNVVFHERCIPNCANCGKNIQHFSCDSIWDSDPPNKKWAARHRRC